MEVEDNYAVSNPSETHLNQDRTPPPNKNTNGLVNYLVASLPPGVCFQPSDQELAGFYLKRKLNNEPLPPNQIQEVHVYKHNPHTLAENYKACGCGEKEWYFFTPRERKYMKGNRPSRTAGAGYWKPNGADKPIKHNGIIVGFKKTLVFFLGKHPKGERTHWMMHEYTVKNPPGKRQGGPNPMRLDEWVLCRIFNKVGRLNTTRNGLQDPNRQTKNSVQPQQWDKQHVQARDDSTMVSGQCSMPLSEILATLLSIIIINL